MWFGRQKLTNLRKYEQELRVGSKADAQVLNPFLLRELRRVPAPLWAAESQPFKGIHNRLAS